MTAVASLFIVLTLSLFVNRLATAALTLTGMSKELASIQSISAFTGVGFTTRASESMLESPERRRILKVLMVLGNAGVVTAVSSLILSFTGLKGGVGWERAAWILGGLVLFALLVRSKLLEKAMHRVLRLVLRRISGARPVDYVRMLDLAGDYVVHSYRVGENDWAAGCPLEELGLFQEGIVVLGIHRSDGSYLGVPRGESEIEEGDQLVLYGLEEDIQALRERKRDSGNEEHEEAVKENEKRRRAQAAEDEARRPERERERARGEDEGESVEEAEDAEVLGSDADG